MARQKKVKVKEPKLEPEKVVEPVLEPEKLVPQDEPRLEAPTPVSVEPPVDPDYLRQYQYKKVNNQPTIGGILTDPDSGSKAQVMKKSLLAQPRVKFFIPKAETEDPKVKLSVNLNGYRLDFPKNVYLEIPLQIAEVISESIGLQASALLPFQIGRDKKTLDALS